MLIPLVVMTKKCTTADEDYVLVVAIKQGNQEAFGKLYDKYAPLLMGIITRIVHTNTIAEQVLQTTFLHIWNQISLFDSSKSSFFTWLLSIARQAALVKANLEQVKNPLYDNPVYVVADNNYNGQSFNADVQKFIFELVFYKGLSCAAAAAIMKMPVEEIKKNIKLAIRNINAITVQ